MQVVEGGICVNGRGTSHGPSKEAVEEDVNSLGIVVGRSDVMQKIAITVRQLAGSPTTTVLLLSRDQLRYRLTY